ncbi:hypothetical protein [Embleya sp. NPDC050493]|uniref:hypothetical protein n=1 Tax=Embleya sp. NPDC050493 TaxID=3363989 RepID=UPI00378C1FC5
MPARQRVAVSTHSAVDASAPRAPFRPPDRSPVMKKLVLALLAAAAVSAVEPAVAYAAPADTPIRFDGIEVHKTVDMSQHWYVDDDSTAGTTSTAAVDTGA